MVANRLGFGAGRDALAQRREDAANAAGGERSGGVQRGLDGLARHETANRAAGERATSKLVGQPLAPGGAEQHGTNDRHSLGSRMGEAESKYRVIRSANRPVDPS